MSPDLRPISVVVPCRNARGWLDQALASVVDAAQREPAVEVVVVDNGSTDGTAEEVERRWGSQVTLLRAPRRTVGALRNLGAAHGGGTILSFVDADCAVAPGYFGIVRELLAETGAAAVGCYYELPPVPTALERAWDRLHAPAQDGPAAMINAGNLAVTRPAFEAVGGFDEVLPTGEDAELCARLRAQGFPVWQDRRMRARHLGNPTSLGRFVAKEYWHALGMFGTVRGGDLDRPFLMTLLHAALLGTAILQLVRGHPGWLALALVAPALAVAYRGMTLHRLPPVGWGLVLYFAYFTARVAALPQAAAIGWHWRRAASRSPRFP